MSESTKKKSSPTPQELTQQVGELREEVDELAGSVGQTLAEAKHLVEDEVRTYPYVSLALGASIGFVLAGGLTAKVGGVLFRYGSKLAIRQLVQRVSSAVNT